MHNRQPTMRSRELGEGLRRAMEAAGLTGVEAARRLDWSPSRVSRMLSGTRGTTKVDVAMFLTDCGVRGRERTRLLAVCQDQGVPGWLQEYGDRLPKQLITLVGTVHRGGRLAPPRKPFGLPDGSGQGAEGVQGGDELAGEAASAVAGVIQHDEPAARPGPVQLPGRVQRPRDVVATVDQHGGDAGQAVHAAADLVRGQEAAVAPVVRERRAKTIRKVASRYCNRGVHPGINDTWVSSQMHHASAAPSRMWGSGSASSRA